MTDGTTTWNYEYNADGLRTSRSNDSTTYEYTYSGDQLVQLVVNSTTESETASRDVLYFTSDTVTYNGTTYYYIKNLQGDVTHIVGATGSVVVSYTYDAWGNILSTAGSMADTLGALNPLRYRGYVYDSESGLYYLQSRYYDPEMGRFINADGLITTNQGLIGYNLLAYCNNNPIMSVDKDGRFSETIQNFIQGAKHGIDVYANRHSIAAIKAVNHCINSLYLLTNQATSPVMSQDYKNTAPWAAYGTSRGGGTRKHMGIDFYPLDGTDHLYGSDGTPRNVYAMKAGTVVDYMPNFYGGTSAIVIDHGDFFALYGEISTELSIGSTVKQGQIIGVMKLSNEETLMLHLEIFVGGYGDYSRYNQYRVDPTYVYSLPDWRT